MRIFIIERLKRRWRAEVDVRTKFDINKALLARAGVDVSPRMLKECWHSIHPRLADDVHFRLLKKAFGPHRDIDDQVEFIRDVLKLHKAMGKPVCLFTMLLFCLSFFLLRRST